MEAGLHFMLFWYFDWKGIRSTGMEKGLLHTIEKDIEENRILFIHYNNENNKSWNDSCCM